MPNWIEVLASAVGITSEPPLKEPYATVYKKLQGRQEEASAHGREAPARGGLV